MMGRQGSDQSQLFYLFNLERHIPAGHLLRRINPVVTRILADLREKLCASCGRLEPLVKLEVYRTIRPLVASRCDLRLPTRCCPVKLFGLLQLCRSAPMATLD